MKKSIWLIIALFLIFCTGVNAQLSFGVKGGVNFATITNYDELDIPQTIRDAFTAKVTSVILRKLFPLIERIGHRFRRRVPAMLKRRGKA